MKGEHCLMLRRLAMINMSLLFLFFLVHLMSPLIFCNQSIRIDERHIPGYIMKVPID